MLTRTRAPLVAGALALMWNLAWMAGVMNGSLGGNAAMAAGSGSASLFEATPAWATAGSIFAALMGCVGALGLLARRAWAPHAFAASLVGLAIQDFWLFSLSDLSPQQQQGPFVIQGAIALMALIAWSYAKLLAGRGELR